MVHHQMQRMKVARTGEYFQDFTFEEKNNYLKENSILIRVCSTAKME